MIVRCPSCGKPNVNPETGLLIRCHNCGTAFEPPPEDAERDAPLAYPPPTPPPPTADDTASQPGQPDDRLADLGEKAQDPTVGFGRMTAEELNDYLRLKVEARRANDPEGTARARELVEGREPPDPNDLAGRQPDEPPGGLPPANVLEEAPEHVPTEDEARYRRLFEQHKDDLEGMSEGDRDFAVDYLRRNPHLVPEDYRYQFEEDEHQPPPEPPQMAGVGEGESPQPGKGTAEEPSAFAAWEQAKEERQRAEDQREHVRGLEEKAQGLEERGSGMREQRQTRNQMRQRNAAFRLAGRVPGFNMMSGLATDVGEALGFVGQEQESEAEREAAQELRQIRELLEEAIRDQMGDGSDITERNRGDQPMGERQERGRRGREDREPEGTGGQTESRRSSTARALIDVARALLPMPKVPGSGS